nr:12667_t:CDS:2 [Entrophospora candida]
MNKRTNAPLGVVMCRGIHAHLVDQSAKERNPRVETKLQGKTQYDQYKTEYDENQRQGKKGLKERNEDKNQSYNNNQQGSAISS